MGRQHETIEQQVHELLPLWAELRDAPERHCRLAGPLAEHGRRLAEQLEEHLALEEEFLFPAARERLTRKHLDRLTAELRHRRRKHP
jgi:iron-sulfur cluster repair protein YtfE (RIC family)